LEGARAIARIERIQHVLLVIALVVACLLVLDWALTRGLFGWLIVGASTAVTAAVHFDWPFWLRGPSAQEWQWGYEGGPFDRPFFAAVACGVAVLAVIGLAASSMARRTPRRAALALLGIGIAAGFGFQLALLDT